MMPTLLVGTRKGLFSVDDLWGPPAIVNTWFTGSPVSAVLRDPRDGSFYAALDHGHFAGKLHRSTNRGKTWSEIATPEYPPKPDGVIDECPMTRRPREWATRLMWSLEAGHGDRPGELWCGTIPGGLFRSTDHGASWSLNRPLWDRPERAEAFGGGYDDPGIHSMVTNPTDPQHLGVAVSCGGYWFTADGGDTWDVGTGMQANYVPDDRTDDPFIQDPHRVARCLAVPEVLWAQHHNGIYRSTDAGRTWHDIGINARPGSFGFAVAAHPHDPETAWFVPAESDEVRVPVKGRMTVTRTQDGGRSFEVLSDGLPQEHAYHLVYRHCLDVSADGRRLAMGTTTGSLWVSHDAGNRWRLVSSNLPPIYTVRFIS